LKAILEAARQAPSARNRQPWHLVVVRDPEMKKQVAEACHEQHWMADAAVIIAACGQPRITEAWYAIDTAIALQNLHLAACSLGYGSCWIGAFREDDVRELLGVPAGMRVVCLTVVGVAAEDPPPPRRKDVDDLFSFERCRVS
jgi:nitroreductase